MSSDSKFNGEACTPNEDLSPAWTIWDAAVDYFSCTARTDTHQADVLADLALTHMSLQADEGHETKPFAFKGGFRGQNVGTVSVGYAEGYILVKVTSSTAHTFVCQLLENGVKYLKPSRIDFQITGHCETDQPARAREIYRYLEDRHEASGTKRPFNCDLKRRSKKGDTLYIGVRESPRFFRIYDKSKETGAYIMPGLWRYEAEFKGKQAPLMFETLRLSQASQRVIIELTVAAFQTKGVDMTWVEKCNPQKLPSSYQKTTREKQLLWMKRNVSRTSKELIDAGYEEMLAQWLGFTPPKRKD